MSLRTCVIVIALALMVLFPASASAAGPTVGIASARTPSGYWLGASDGGVLTYGEAGFFGSMGGQPLQTPVVGIASTVTGKGYWLTAADGGVFAFGDALFSGSMSGQPLNRPVVGIAATPNAGAYWLTAADGGVFAFGGAPFHGSMGGRPLNQPVVGIAATPSGGGYWLVAADGGVFAFGDAPHLGALAGQTLNAPVVGMAGTPSGKGYRLVAADGGVFAFGDAGFHGARAGQPLNAPVVGLTATPSGSGHWLAAADGGVFAYGDAVFAGSLPGGDVRPEPEQEPLPRPVAGVRVTTQPVGGQVLVKVPAGDAFVLLGAETSLPVGTVVDARKGSLVLTAAADASGRTESATLAAGIFRIRQAQARGKRRAPLDFALVTPAGLSRACAKRPGPPKGIVRTLTVAAKGTFGTVGARGVVKGRDATWTTTDRCDGTLTTVRRGRVSVRARSRTVSVRAGHRYLVRARLFAARRRG